MRTNMHAPETACTGNGKRLADLPDNRHTALRIIAQSKKVLNGPGNGCVLEV
jgi:hypothetical protein